MAFLAKDKIVRTGGDLTLQYVTRVVKVALASAAGGGGVLSWKNPEETTIIVNRLVINITDAAAEAELIDFGKSATATGSSDTLFSDLAADAAGVSCSIVDGKSGVSVAAGEFVTGTASGALSSFVGNAYIHYTLA